jgi:hypothetical protein
MKLFYSSCLQEDSFYDFIKNENNFYSAQKMEVLRWTQLEDQIIKQDYDSGTATCWQYINKTIL